MRSGYESELSLIFGGEDIKMDRILFLLERTHQYERSLYWMKMKFMIFGMIIPTVLSIAALIFSVIK